MKIQHLHYSSTLTVFVMLVLFYAPILLGQQSYTLKDYQIIISEVRQEEINLLNKRKYSPSGRFETQSTVQKVTIKDLINNDIHHINTGGFKDRFRWSKKEDRVVFLTSKVDYTGRSKQVIALYLFDEKRLEIIEKRDYNFYSPSISPDGNYILAIGGVKKSGNPFLSIDVKSGDIAKLDLSSAYFSPNSLKWIQNSPTIIYSGKPDISGESIYKIDLKTLQKSLIMKADGTISGWLKASPSGDKIVYAAHSGLVRHIYTVNIDGTNQSEIDSFHYEGNVFIEWSPSGKYLIYALPKVGGHHHKQTKSSQLILFDLLAEEKLQLTSIPNAKHRLERWESDFSMIISSEISGEKSYKWIELVSSR